MSWPFDPHPPLSYDVIIADPPWPFDNYSAKGERKGAKRHYATLGFDDIAALPVGKLGRGDCILMMWCCWPTLPQALDVMTSGWGFCVGVGTRVLTYDLRWVPAESLKIGDQVLGFDEWPRGNRRYYKRSTVLSNGVRPLNCYEIELADGRKITASSEHSWLTQTSTAGPESTMRWLTMEQLAKSLNHHSRSKLMLLPQLLPVCDFDKSYESGFLAGAFDGEGCLTEKKPHLMYSQNPNEMFAFVEELLHLKGLKVTVHQHGRKCLAIGLRGGLSDTLTFLMQFRPPRQISRWMSFKNLPSVYNTKKVPIASIRFVGERECATLQTDSSTYIAEGFGAHNTYVTGGAWHKRTSTGKSAFGTGYVLRSATEPYLIGTLGNPKTSRDIRNVIETSDATVIDAERREHSRKPDVQYEILERMFPAAVRRIELFARQQRPGWDSFGHEKEKFDAA